MANTTTKNGQTFINASRIGECGFRDEKIHFPFFLMGACGDDRAVISLNGKREVLKIYKSMNYRWFHQIAKKLDENDFFDWDWESFKRNVLQPNREHIKKALKISDEKVDRLLRDGYVFLNNFNKDWDEDEDDETKKLHFPNFNNFLKYDDLEY